MKSTVHIYEAGGEQKASENDTFICMHVYVHTRVCKCNFGERSERAVWENLPPATKKGM